MPPRDDELGDAPPLDPRDAAVLDVLARGSEWARAVACTLARRGGAFRRDHPERAKTVLEALRTSPLFKGGQFLFDLMEWEDFMLDGPPPPMMDTALDARALSRLAELVESARGHLDGAASGRPGEVQVDFVQELSDGPVDGDLPELEPSLYLYEDVVLGVVRSVGNHLHEAGDSQR